MKAETLTKRLRLVAFYKNGKPKKAFFDVIDLLIGAEKKHHYLQYYAGKWKGVPIKDYCGETLTAMGIDYDVDNDAPRGGATGNYIYLTEKGKRQVREFRKLIRLRALR